MADEIETAGTFERADGLTFPGDIVHNRYRELVHRENPIRCRLVNPKTPDEKKLRCIIAGVSPVILINPNEFLTHFSLSCGYPKTVINGQTGMPKTILEFPARFNETGQRIYGSQGCKAIDFFDRWESDSMPAPEWKSLVKSCEADLARERAAYKADLEEQERQRLAHEEQKLTPANLAKALAVLVGAKPA